MFSCGNASTANSASKSSNTSKISVSKNDNSKASSVAHDSPTESVTTDEGESGIITNGSVRNCVSVLDYGVVPNLNADQYDKFKRAIDTGNDKLRAFGLRDVKPIEKAIETTTKVLSKHN